MNICTIFFYLAYWIRAKSYFIMFWRAPWFWVISTKGLMDVTWCKSRRKSREMITIIILVRKDTVYHNSAWWENCEFCPTFAYSKTWVILILKLSHLFHHIPIADVIKAIYTITYKDKLKRVGTSIFPILSTTLYNCRKLTSKNNIQSRFGLCIRSPVYNKFFSVNMGVALSPESE